MKPFSIRSLFGRKEPKEKDRRENTRTVPQSGTTILIVDDSKTVRKVLSKMLSEGGYETLEAKDGETAIEIARTKLPNLILMDVVMPGITGFHATRKLHKDPLTENIPIVIMSGNEQAIEQFWVTRIGAQDFMTKPFSRFEVFRRIEKILYNNQLL